MLRALAGYLLGGILNDSTQEAMECETREVNDWLVVNMPNKPEESDIDLDSERESDIDEREVLEDQDIDFDSNAGSETDEDEVLTCLPMLMSYEELEYKEPVFEEKTPMEEISSVVLYNPPKIQRIQIDDSSLLPQGKFHSNARPLAKLNELHSNLPEPELESCGCPKNGHLRKYRVRWLVPPVKGCPKSEQKVQSSIRLSSARKIETIASEMVKPLGDQCPELKKQISSECIQSIWPEDRRFPQKIPLATGPHSKPGFAMIFAFPSRVNPTALSELMDDIRRARHIQMPTYINHRPSSSVINKADLKKQLQEQIKEIRPAQQAKNLSLKKQNSRSQMKRHNQNYIYSSSAKASRRKDLQRNHSGANNNRKCF